MLHAPAATRPRLIQRHCPAEGDTNEEGYVLNIQPKMLEGAARVTLSEVYWSELHDGASPSKFTCTRD